jgi:hypothetical protein
MVRESLNKLLQSWLGASGARGRFGAVLSASTPKSVGTRARNRRRKKSALPENGVSILETLVASTILLIVVTGVLPVFILGFQSTEQQGDIATRTTEYAQDKMESLVNLIYTDNQTDTTVYPPAATGGTGLGVGLGASSTVGAVPPTAPVAGYVDYLDTNGTLLTTSAGAYYTRQWSISTDSTNTLKTITVVVTSLQVGAVKGKAPSTTLVSIKSSGL